MPANTASTVSLLPLAAAECKTVRRSPPLMLWEEKSTPFVYKTRRKKTRKTNNRRSLKMCKRGSRKTHGPSPLGADYLHASPP